MFVVKKFTDLRKESNHIHVSSEPPVSERARRPAVRQVRRRTAGGCASAPPKPRADPAPEINYLPANYAAVQSAAARKWAGTTDEDHTLTEYKFSLLRFS
ncbi:hypothetical protein EVAR_37749_1 [Eumeta japonica]|uniref:Uncharacterized protein n=1 Tax=Eumeta variegata TaxID=151549 RepID=A0A4C1WPA8_EUMVA|nr:hypothetical protein EVAR_37749_1 [Eumeta japonica]